MNRKRITVIFVVTAVLIIFWLVFAPPRLWLNLTKSVDLSNPAVTGEQLVADYNCRRCHRVGGGGSLKAPNLAGVTERLDDVSLRLWLHNPKAVKGNTAMPNFHLSDSEVEAIVAYLQKLDASASSGGEG